MGQQAGQRPAVAETQVFIPALLHPCLAGPGLPGPWSPPALAKGGGGLGEGNQSSAALGSFSSQHHPESV